MISCDRSPCSAIQNLRSLRQSEASAFGSLIWIITVKLKPLQQEILPIFAYEMSSYQLAIRFAIPSGIAKLSIGYDFHHLAAILLCKNI